MKKNANLYDRSSVSPDEEVNETLYADDKVRIERIISTGRLSRGFGMTKKRMNGCASSKDRELSSGGRQHKGA